MKKLSLIELEFEKAKKDIIRFVKKEKSTSLSKLADKFEEKHSPTIYRSAMRELLQKRILLADSRWKITLNAS